MLSMPSFPGHVIPSLSFHSASPTKPRNEATEHPRGSSLAHCLPFSYAHRLCGLILKSHIRYIPVITSESSTQYNIFCIYLIERSALLMSVLSFAQTHSCYFQLQALLLINITCRVQSDISLCLAGAHRGRCRLITQKGKKIQATSAAKKNTLS